MAKQSRQSIVKTANTIAVERRHQMIAIAAYYRAERRAFRDGDPVIDWLEAEAEVDAMLKRSPRSEKTPKPPQKER